MTKDEIIRMAHDAGLHLATDVNWMPIVGFEYAQKFANLVAEHEREACAKVCLSEWSTLEQMDAGGVFAAAIRARGEKA